MGYQIKYSPEDNHKYPAVRTGRKPKWGMLIVVTAVILALAGIPQLRGRLEGWLIPGDSKITKAAFSDMLEQLRTGEPLSDAVTAFCREIIESAKTQVIQDT